MVPPGRLLLLLVGAAAACLGLGLGADLQHERYLGPVGGDNTINLGEPILLTGLLVALGGVAMALAVAPALAPPTMPRPVADNAGRPNTISGLLLLPFLKVQRAVVHARHVASWKLRPAVVTLTGAATVLFLATYVAVNLVQNAWPTVVAASLQHEGQAATQLPYFMSIGLLASNSRDVLPATLVPVMAILVGAFMAMAWSFSVLMLAGVPPRPTLPSRVLARQVAALGVAAPFLALTGWAAIRFLVILPADSSSGPFLLVLPACALAAWGLLTTSFLKSWHLARALREPTRAPVALDSWQALGRVEAGLAAALGLVAIVAFALPRVAVAGLQDPAAPFGVASINIFLQFLILLAIPLLPLALLHRRGLRLLQIRSQAAGPAFDCGRLLWVLPVAAAACFILAGWSTWSMSRALWGWVLASLPLAVLGLLASEAVAAAPAMLLSAAALWGIGNTIYATYQPGPVGLPEFDTTPGILGLWRLCGATLAAIALARLARAQAPRLRPSVAVPLAIAFGCAIAVLAFVELPLSAGPDHATDGRSIVVGSTLATSDRPVQLLYHGLAAVAMTGAAMSLASILRPEWFIVRPRGGVPKSASDAMT